jgi:hypothetical protein
VPDDAAALLELLPADRLMWGSDFPHPEGLGDPLGYVEVVEDLPDETQAPIRVCFGLGPIIHRELAGIRSVHRTPAMPPTSGPEWFVRMDRNKDNDLTRGEFPGTDDQFAAMDADGDELISADEALAYDRKADGGRSGNLEQPAVSTGSNTKEQAEP